MANADPAAIAEDGDSEEITGTGFTVNALLAITNCALLLATGSAHGMPGRGVKAPVDGLIANPMICADGFPVGLAVEVQ